MVIQSDDQVDQLNRQAFKFLVKKMQTEPATIETCAHLIILTRNLERLADHETNIAENLVFFVDAKIITHRNRLNKPAKAVEEE
jgi:phosphate transport system protein